MTPDDLTLAPADGSPGPSARPLLWAIFVGASIAIAVTLIGLGVGVSEMTKATGCDGGTCLVGIPMFTGVGAIAGLPLGMIGAFLALRSRRTSPALRPIQWGRALGVGGSVALVTMLTALSMGVAASNNPTCHASCSEWILYSLVSGPFAGLILGVIGGSLASRTERTGVGTP